MTVDELVRVDILFETREMTSRGYRRLDGFGNGFVVEKENEPKFRYLGHFVDDFCKYVRLTDRYKIK
jgi:hypothetical protein